MYWFFVWFVQNNNNNNNKNFSIAIETVNTKRYYRYCSFFTDNILALAYCLELFVRSFGKHEALISLDGIRNE